MRPHVIGVLALAIASALLLLSSTHRPIARYREYRPSAAEIWSTASGVASSASEAAAGAVAAVSEVASAVVGEATAAFSASPTDAAIESAIDGFEHAMKQLPRAAADPQCNRDHSRPLSADDMLCRVPKGGLAFIALANAAYGELAVNWALLLLPVLQKVGHADRAVLAALDKAGLDAFTARRLPTISTESFGGIGFNARHKGRMDGFRWETGAFRAYGVTKAEVILWMLRAGRDVCMSDVDAAWIAPPYSLLSSVPEADVLAGTDCLHVPHDADRSTRSTAMKNCGHQPGAKRSAWFNTGVMLFRPTQNAIDIVQEWREMMDAIKGDAQIDDQLTFNQLMGTVWSSGKFGTRFRKFYPLKNASADGRVVFDGNGTRKVHAVQANQFCSAHVYHVQQNAEARGCLVLHLTFVEGWPKNPAKYWRLREAGLLAVHPEPFDQQYLSFTPPHPATIPPESSMPDPGKTADGKGWTVNAALRWSPRLYAHLQLVDRHIAALRNAIGVARALGRRLVMPRMLCLCERAEGPMALLPKCFLDGSSTPVPHVCPLESVYDVARLGFFQKYVPLHPWTLFNSSMHRPPLGAKPFDLSRDMTIVKWDNSSTPQPTPAQQRVVRLGRGLSDVQIKEAFAAAGALQARVVHLESAEGVFGGFESAQEDKLFQEAIYTHLLGGWSATWCCTSWDKPRGTLQFKRPLRLPSGSAARGPRQVVDLPAKRDCYWQDRSNCNLE
ncbi:hypothetical protein AB1Y20_005282 [Prymnesium parvum]|uniref:Nucleotide-diphospho-sugar transferase domain-containing protein n=1 Tax=Prymnesium parvum TaxID=97485 RepID=A0AB34J3U4_PRYPA